MATGISMVGGPTAPAAAGLIAVVGSKLYKWSAAEGVWAARARVESWSGIDAWHPALRTLWFPTTDPCLRQNRDGFDACYE